MRERIRAETGLTASAGVSYNKFLAKLASDQNKPDGLCVVLPEHGAAFVAALPVRRFHGVGPVTTRKMQALGIETGADLRAQDLKFLERHFGRSARYYYWASRGRDERPVRANALRKSIGAERTFFTALLEKGELLQALEPIIEERSEEHTSELQSLMRNSYAVFCLKKNNQHIINIIYTTYKNDNQTKIHIYT